MRRLLVLFVLLSVGVSFAGCAWLKGQPDVNKIIAKVKKDYEDRAAIIFLDVWRDPGLGKKFGIRAIPTQIFYDRDGKEVYRHLGFMDEKSMVAALQKLGVPPKAVP